ncbi:MAG: LicD family protein [Clostridia bacterium]|nr:LicD family protein [Clostridia bacterium]
MGIFKNLSSRKNVLNTIKTKSGYIAVDDELRKTIQNSLLEMLVDIDKVCSENQIEFFLCGGSCLGAVRHSGFIPWDDDVDIAMTREAYMRFVEVFESNMCDKYILNAPNYSKESISRFPKVLKKDSVYITGDTTNIDLCKLYIDIFLLENVPENKFVRAVKGILCNGLEFISGQVHFIRYSTVDERKMYKEYDAVSYYIRLCIGKLFSFLSVSTYNNLVDKVVQYKNEKSKLYGFPTGRKHYFGEILPRETFFPLIRLPFEGYMMPVPENYKRYLKNLYGNFMQIPDEDKREHHYIKKIQL